MIKYEEATEEMVLAWHEAFCVQDCDYSPCKEYGGCDEECCFEFHQDYYPEEFKETMEEDNLAHYREQLEILE